MLLHARGIDHHSKGVDNVLACINLGLATGRFGKPGCGVSRPSPGWCGGACAALLYGYLRRYYR